MAASILEQVDSLQRGFFVATGEQQVPHPRFARVRNDKRD
jgi:hypothetical protein